MKYFVELNWIRSFADCGKLYPVNETTGNFPSETFSMVNAYIWEDETGYILELPQ